MLNNNQNDSSLYRGPPTYDREKAWEALEARKFQAPTNSLQALITVVSGTIFDLPSTYLERLEKTHLQQKAKSSSSANGGYIAFLEVHQQLQCLVCVFPVKPSSNNEIHNSSGITSPMDLQRRICISNGRPP
jgi:hypothetical protein